MAPQYAATRRIASITGIRELQNRLSAVADPTTRQKGMAQLGLLSIRYAKEEAPVKTGNLQRSIRLASSTPAGATVVAASDYARAVHDGARAHAIVPRIAKALAWPANKADRRLTGSPRSSTRRASMVFRRKVSHPGNKANPFLRRGIQRAAKEGGAGVIDAIVKAWNGAA